MAGNSVRFHISLQIRHGDLATMETLLAGDWPRASTHRLGLHSYRDMLKKSNIKKTSQDFHKHSVASAR